MAVTSDIIVVGGGFAGLLCARELAVAGNRVVLLEASPRLGGRALSVKQTRFDTPLELGAEFIHGDLPLTMALLKEAGIPAVEVTGERSFNQNGSWSKEGVGMEKAIQKMNSIEEDLSLDAFLEKFYGEDRHLDLRNGLLQMARGFDLAETSVVSTKALGKEWMKQEEKEFRPQQGYGSLVGWLEECCRQHGVQIHTSTVVHTIDWQRGSVNIQTPGEIFQAAKVIVTVPISMLQQANKNAPGFIDFNPPIVSHQKAAGDIGFGTVIKIFMQFEKPFWKEQQPDASFIISNQMLPAWWTQSPVQSNMLTGWLGGPGAKALHAAGEDVLLKVSLQSLSGIFNISTEDLSAALNAFTYTDWTSMPFIGGGYSFATVHTEEARKILQQPVENSIFFAGEAIHTSDAPGTVEAALQSAITVASSLV